MTFAGCVATTRILFLGKATIPTPNSLNKRGTGNLFEFNFKSPKMKNLKSDKLEEESDLMLADSIQLLRRRSAGIDYFYCDGAFGGRFLQKKG